MQSNSSRHVKRRPAREPASSLASTLRPLIPPQMPTRAGQVSMALQASNLRDSSRPDTRPCRPAILAEIPVCPPAPRPNGPCRDVSGQAQPTPCGPTKPRAANYEPRFGDPPSVSGSACLQTPIRFQATSPSPAGAKSEKRPVKRGTRMDKMVMEPTLLRRPHKTSLF